MTKHSMTGAMRINANSIKKFPKKHLLLVTGVAAAVLTVIGMLPSTEVEAKRSDLELVIDAYQPDSTREALLSASKPQETAKERAVKELAAQESARLAEEEARLGKWQSLTISSGDNLSILFGKMGLGARVVYDISQPPKAGKVLTDIRPGQILDFRINSEGELTQFRYVQSKLNSIMFEKGDNGYSANAIALEPEIRTAYSEGIIENSLFLSSQKAGLPDNMTMELATIFGWDIDFVQDIREGDHFNLIYEEKYLDNEKLGNGNILAATFTNQGETYTAVRYTDSKGDSNYYTPDGKSMKKAFIRTPVDFTRISSKYNPDRLHPIFKTKRPHRAVDYAAPSGTPIKAAGDGKIQFIGWQNGYGNVVFINHPNNIVTVYAHQSRVNKKFKKGGRVKQGQIIGYVGQTGWATGPHLHYEFRVNGVHRNPMTVKLPDAAPIPKKEKARFLEHSGQILATLETHSGSMLAINQQK